MPFLLVSDFISNQYQKLCKIRNFMRHAPLGKTHMDMWQEVDPVLAHFYDIINKKIPNSPYDAFLKVYFRGGPTIEENMAPLLSRHLVHNIPLSEYLKTCTHDCDDFEALRDTLPELAAEKWLANDLNFAIYSPEEQSEILDVLQTFVLSEITLRNYSALRDFNLRPLLQGQKSLQKLTLIGCDKLTNAALNTIFEVHPNLELTLVGCPGITQEAIASFKSKNIKVRNLGELAVLELQAAPQGFEEQMKELTQALDTGNWKQIRERHTALKTAGIGDKAEILIIEHLIKTDQMRKIVKANAIDALEFLAHINFKFSDRDINDAGLFHLCCQEGNAEMLRWLCRQPVKWEEVVDQKGATPLHAAVASENLACLQVLKEANAPINLQDASCVGPLRFALERKAVKIASWLIEGGANIEEKNWHKQTLLHLSCQNGLTEVVNLLLQRSPTMADCQDDTGKIPLYSAIEFGHIDCFHRVLNAMKSAQHADTAGITPLMQAAKLNHPEMVRALLGKEANPKDINKEEMNAAQVAALAGSLPCLKMLLGENPPVQALSIKRKDGKTLLHLGALSGNVEMIRFIGEQGLSNMQAKSLEDRKTALIHQFADDAGFRPDSLLLLRSIEEQHETHAVQESALFIHKLQEIYRGWNCALPKEISAHHLTLRYDTPLTPQQIRERWLCSDKSQHLEEIACMIPLLGRPGDILQQRFDLAESNTPLTEKELIALFALLAHLRGHEAWTAADFLKATCQRMIATLSKFKKSALKDSAAAAKEFLDDPSHAFPKLRLDGDWREKGLKERAQKLLGELSDTLKYPKNREDLINHLTSSIMGLHKELFQRIKISDFRAGANPVSKEAVTALTELQRSSRDLTANCLIFLLQDGGYDMIGKRIEFVIDWMRKSILYGDFHQATALYEAIEHPSVSRLKKALDRISSSSREQLLQLEKLFLPEADFQHYFACLRQRLSPSILSLSIMLRLYSQKESPEARFALLHHIQEHRAFAAKLTLPPINAASECLRPLTSELFPQEYRRKREDSRPGELFAWKRSNLLKSNKSFIASGKVNRLINDK